ncbi:MAG: hypothetical protein ABMA13_18165 [Chthoniobacteraceae bacterium]
MPRRPDARALLFERIRTTPAKFVHIIGVPYAVELEATEDPTLLDRVWLTVEAPPFGRLRISLNTLSRLNRDAGFDASVRVGIVKVTWQEKPAPGLAEDPGQSYAKIEAAFPVSYAALERDALAELLIERAKRAVRAEVWGDLYAAGEHLGIHQVHSRRASAAVPSDVRNRDAALKLYYPEENAAELFLFKFAGQP